MKVWSDMENIILVANGMDKTREEFLHAKADNLKAKTTMLNKISTDGFVSLQELPKQKTEKVALNTLDVYFTAAGIKTNLVTNGLLLPRTLRNKRDVNSISSTYQK